LISELELDPNVALLGSLAQIGIGVVTGDTKYFIKSSGDWRAEGIGRSHLTYIVPKSRWVTGVCLRKVDRERHEQEGIPCLALDAPATPRASALLRYLAQYDEEKISKNATFAKRAIWFRFLDGRAPDALFVFMTHLGPRVVVNDAKADTTNGLYRVQFKPGAKRKSKLIAISMQTTFAQLAAEQLGRALGSGALKLEPCDAKLLPIFLPKKTAVQIRVAFEIINQHMQSGDADLARKAADQFIFSDSSTFKVALGQLESYLETARRRRMRNEQRVFTQ
jgi:adenine-specific DNA-methyltransferase